MFFLIFKSFQNFPFMSLFHGSPVLPCRSLCSVGMDFIAVTGVSCRLLCRPYLIAMAAAASASLKPEEGFELKTNKSKTPQPHHIVPVFRFFSLTPCCSQMVNLTHRAAWNQSPLIFPGLPVSPYSPMLRSYLAAHCLKTWQVPLPLHGLLPLLVASVAPSQSH